MKNGTASARAFFLVIVVLFILRSRVFADRRIYRVVASIGAAGRVHRSFGVKRRHLRMKSVGYGLEQWRWSPVRSHAPYAALEGAHLEYMRP